MDDIAIRVERLGKLCHIGARQQRHDTLRDALSGLFRRNGKQHDDETDLWALKDVSFEVQRGEVVGPPSMATLGELGMYSGQASAAMGGEEHPAQDSLAHHRADRRPRGISCQGSGDRV